MNARDRKFRPMVINAAAFNSAIISIYNAHGSKKALEETRNMIPDITAAMVLAIVRKKARLTGNTEEGIGYETVSAADAMTKAQARKAILDYLVTAVELNDDSGGGQFKIYGTATPLPADDETTLEDLIRRIAK